MAERARPLSPHLQIYKPQIGSATSIFHRFSGIALTLGTLLLMYWLSALAGGPATYETAQAVFGSVLGRLLLFGWTAALFYHFCNGIRHLLWDAGYGLDIEIAERSGLVVIAASLVLTILAWILGYALMG